MLQSCRRPVHFLVISIMARIMARYSIFSRLSSVGNTDLDLVTLRSWLKASGIQMGQVSRQNREQKRIRELEAENRSLRRQLGEKDEVIDVLKKSVGILSKP